MAPLATAINYKPSASQTSTQQHAFLSNEVNRRAPLPSVLAPNPLPSMACPTATSHLIEILGQGENQSLPLLPRPVTIVHYDVNGAPIISPHLPGIDEFILTSEYTLQRLVLHIQNVLDTKMDFMEEQDRGNERLALGQVIGDAITKDMMDEKGKLLVSSIEVRGGGERFFKEFPGIMGEVVWGGRLKGVASRNENPNGKYDGREAEYVMWNRDGGELQMYWDHYRMVVMKGIMLQVERPILKVRTVRRVATEGAGLVAGGHVFTRSFPPDEETSADLSKESEKEEVADGTEEPLHQSIPDLSSLDAPEFQVVMLFQEELKHNDNPDLEYIYNSFLEQGGEPMKELVFKDKEGYGRVATWVEPDGLIPDDGSDVETIRANQSPRELTVVSLILPTTYDPKLRAQLAEALEAAVSFDPKDDAIFFSSGHKPPTTRPRKKFQPRRRQNTIINLFRNRVQGTLENNSGGGSLNSHDMGTPGSSNWCSPSGPGYLPMVNSPTPSTPSNIVPSLNMQSASSTPTLDSGSRVEARRTSPLRRLATTSQLRPDSPIFNYPQAKTISNFKTTSLDMDLLGLFNGNKTPNAVSSAPGSDMGRQTPVTNPMVTSAAHTSIHGSQNDLGTGFSATMTQTPSGGAEPNVNFQSSLSNQNATQTESTDTRASSYQLYPDLQQGQGSGFNPSMVHNPFVFNDDLYGGYVGASPNAGMAGDHLVDMNFGAGGYPFDFSDPSNFIFNNANFMNGFGGSM
ncbi:uncharacterized protein BP5553_02175 [Venustampulla echinocandica]|uniref:Uncharacterized protein n=1 Tax=Venustampulla echinocandica TaxID=2656787 RepID=A0A370U341_9HELO|nr:uncharacterized protein BP5553_02175 [Venustampulla echinocandica]RDL42196.1 hypothetical protein BP5553_02175 [Venustampulla echinocandica]